MVFSSLVFLFYFLPITLLVYYAFKNRTWRNIILLLMSLFFYSWGEPIYILLILSSIFFNWILALAIVEKNKFRTEFFISGILVNLAGIGVFKYGQFFLLNVSELTGKNLQITNIALPIGISFYTFQAISYLVDVYRGDIAPQKNPFYFGAYLSMFPQLIAGPIVRYATIERELSSRKENVNDFADGLRRFIIGFSKKIFIANTMGTVADTILAAEPSTVGAIPAWYAFIAYAFQIYFDFSGYSDMAIGLGRMFGFYYLENFNYPYIARSVTEFWRRWHISLSTFFRDYLYIPLGGNQVGKERWILNILIVWSLTGLWHGASWNFVCWGLYYGVILIGEKKIWAKWLNHCFRPFQHVYTIFLFIIGWVIFRIDTVEDIEAWILTLFGFNGLGHVSTLNVLNVLQLYPWFLVAAVASTPVMRNISTRYRTLCIGSWSYDACTVLLFLTALTKLATGAFNPFIYFRF